MSLLLLLMFTIGGGRAGGSLTVFGPRFLRSEMSKQLLVLIEHSIDGIQKRKEK
jgi:hypothetical protein